MRINEVIIIDIETMEVLERESYEYQGPVALCGGSSSPPPAEKTEEELALITTQTDIMKQQLEVMKKQYGEQEMFTPYIMRTLGFAQDEGGAWREMTQQEKYTAMSPLEQASYKSLMLSQGMDEFGTKLTEEQRLANMSDLERIEYQTSKLSGERTLKALQGDLPISPALEAELSAQREQMEETLARKLGPNWQLSTPGQKAIAELEAKSAMIREEARRGEIDAGTVRFQNQLVGSLSKQQTGLGNLGATAQTSLANLSGISNRYGNTAEGAMGTIKNLQAGFEKDRDLRTSVEMQNAANKTAATTGAYTAVGTAAAAAAAAYSDERLKNIDGVYIAGVDEIMGIEPIIFTWKADAEYGDKLQAAGFSAQDLEKSLPHAITRDAAGYLMIQPITIIAALVNAVKELKNEIDTLKGQN